MWSNEKLHLLDHRLCFDDLNYKIFKSGKFLFHK